MNDIWQSMITLFLWLEFEDLIASQIGYQIYMNFSKKKTRVQLINTNA